MPFYGARSTAGWGAASTILALVQFVLPFFALLSYDLKRRRGPLAAVALWLLAAHYVDVYWLVMLPLAVFSGSAVAQQSQRAPNYVSPEVTADRQVIFRIYAPNAQTVRVGGTDMPGLPQAAPMTKGENGVWELTFGPVNPKEAGGCIGIIAGLLTGATEPVTTFKLFRTVLMPLTFAISVEARTFAAWLLTLAATNPPGGNPVDTFVVTADADFTLTDWSLKLSVGESIALTSIQQALLTGGAGDNTFDVSGWTGTATLVGGSGTGQQLFGDTRPELDRSRKMRAFHQPFDGNRRGDVERLA